MSRPRHLLDEIVLALAGVTVLALLAAIIEGGALAVIVVLMALGVLLLVIPFAVIHYDEHPDRLVKTHPHEEPEHLERHRG